ncbi:MAG: dTDP-4-dehydrorhamnose 3,5-epimerase family protein [Actinomycetota bacterium]
MVSLGLVDGHRIDGVRTRRIERNSDDRGWFAEYFVAGDDQGIDPVQWSVVRSAPRVLRGMHLHVGHDEFFSIVSGRVTLGLHDLRALSPTFGRAATYEFCGADPIQLIFPRGLVHGWLFHEESVHLQATSRAHDDYHPQDNHGCHWSDPELGIAWPMSPTVVAARAEGFGSLRELRATVTSQTA